RARFACLQVRRAKGSVVFGRSPAVKGLSPGRLKRCTSRLTIPASRSRRARSSASRAWMVSSRELPIWTGLMGSPVGIGPFGFGWIVLVLIVCATFPILGPVDAFTDLNHY